MSDNRKKIPSLNYGFSLYEGEKLKNIIPLYVKHLPKDVNTLISCSSSSTIIAAGICLLSKQELRHFHVYKEGRQSHREKNYQGNDFWKDSISCFVDDLVCTGETVRRALSVWNQQDKFNYLLLYRREKSSCALTDFGKRVVIVTAEEKRL